MQWIWDDVEKWEELRPYVDTALLPSYYYDENVDIPEHVKRMGYLMKLAVAVEQRLKGRVLLYPLAYQTGEKGGVWKVPGSFRYYFILRFTGHSLLPEATDAEAKVEILTVGDEDLESSVRFDITVDVLCQTILKNWQGNR
ncbi:DUF2487 family protein [Brevibacillus fluminis]|uniref:DUF2487 family protein n=1 Tax=Brevibacillus fluminis TaxID=511487 RepID=UPI003F891C0C